MNSGWHYWLATTARSSKFRSCRRHTSKFVLGSQTLPSTLQPHLLVFLCDPCNAPFSLEILQRWLGSFVKEEFHCVSVSWYVTNFLAGLDLKENFGSRGWTTTTYYSYSFRIIIIIHLSCFDDIQIQPVSIRTLCEGGKSAWLAN